MRINQFVALATGMSRRASDKILDKVTVNGKPAQIGQQVTDSDTVVLDGKIIEVQKKITIILNKPVGYVCSRNGQGSQTIYDLLPEKYQNLKPIGRLDKDSSGLLLLTNDGDLAQKLSHPKYQKEKVYEVTLDKPLAASDFAKLKIGIKVENYISKLVVSSRKIPNTKYNILNSAYEVRMAEGHNRQIRRTFAALNYTVTSLHRTQFGSYSLDNLGSAFWQDRQ